MQKEWVVRKGDPAQAERLAKEVGISPILADILCQRGIRDKESAERFLHPDTKQEFYDPFLMKGMEEAVNRVEQAIRKKERIVVYGDYDVDGMTATAVMMRALLDLDADVECYIPDRQREGYGLHVAALQRIAEEGVKLVVSVDCGISAVEEVAALRDRLDIVVTDHHLPGDQLPNAIAVVNPHQKGCPYPFKDLAGVGVAFKLCQALKRRMAKQEDRADLELVALGTIADLVPLLGENRKIVRLGLERMSQTEIPGIRALIQVSKLREGAVSAGQVAFQLAPRLNAAGRLATARQGVDLLLSADGEEAHRLAEELDAANTSRQDQERELLSAIEEKYRASKQEKGPELHSIVISGEGWHPGLIGLAASRLVERHFLPAIVISEQGEIAKGSCRSIPGLHIYEALAACGEFLQGFGGHAQAAGITLRTRDIPAFRDAFDRYVGETLQDGDYVPKLVIDCLLSPEDADLSLVEELELLEPCGMGNPRPVFGCRDVRCSGARSMGREQEHLMFHMEGRERSVRAVGWRMAGYAPILEQERVDLAYVPEINEWQGRRSVEGRIEFIGPAASDRKFPDRDWMAGLYRLLASIQRERGSIPMDACELATVHAGNRGKTSLYAVESALAVFEDMGLLYAEPSGKGYFLPPPPKKKLDLMQSRICRINQKQ